MKLHRPTGIRRPQEAATIGEPKTHRNKLGATTFKFEKNFMKQKFEFIWARFEAAAPVAFVAASLVWAGCGANDAQQQASAQANEEIARLRDENQDLEKLRNENHEVQKLRKENQDIHKLRGQFQDIARLRKESDQMRGQIAKFPAAAGQGAAAGALNSPESTARAPGALAQTAGGVLGSALPLDPNIPQEGDEIFIEPKQLAKLLPEMDWSKVERTQPVGVKALLDQRGITFTNYLQLAAYGITNYSIQRAAPAAPAPK